MASQQVPYPEGSIFAVHKGFKPGVYRTFREFRSQTEGFPRKVFAVFSDEKHAEIFVQTGNPPPGVEPLVPNHPAGRLPDNRAVPSAGPSRTITAPRPTKIVTSTPSDTTLKTTQTFPNIIAPLPTPSASPDRTAATPFVSTSQPTRSPGYDGNSDRPYSSQPVRLNPPPAPQKPIKAEDDAEMDQGGDTEPEDEGRPFAPTVNAHVLPTTPAQASGSGGPVRQTQSAITPGTKPLRRSIADVLRREISSGTVFPQIKDGAPASTSGVSVLPSGSPSKLDHPDKSAVAGANPTALSTPDPTPAPHVGHKRTRECTNCGGTGRVPCSDVESDSSRANDRVIKRPSAGSATRERRMKPLSEGKRSEGRLAKLRAHADKEKGKARAANEVTAESSTPLAHKYLIYAVAFVVFVDFTERFLGLRNVVVWLFHLV